MAEATKTGAYYIKICPKISKQEEPNEDFNKSKFKKYEKVFSKNSFDKRKEVELNKNASDFFLSKKLFQNDFI